MRSSVRSPCSLPSLSLYCSSFEFFSESELLGFVPAGTNIAISQQVGLVAVGLLLSHLGSPPPRIELMLPRGSGRQRSAVSGLLKPKPIRDHHRQRLLHLLLPCEPQVRRWPHSDSCSRRAPVAPNSTRLHRGSQNAYIFSRKHDNNCYSQHSGDTMIALKMQTRRTCLCSASYETPTTQNDLYGRRNYPRKLKAKSRRCDRRGDLIVAGRTVFAKWPNQRHR